MIYGYLNGQQTMLIMNNIPVKCQFNLKKTIDNTYLLQICNSIYLLLSIPLGICAIRHDSACNYRKVSISTD